MLTLVENYGWHCHRLFLWLMVIVASLVAPLLALPIEYVLQQVMHFRTPFALVVAFVPLLFLRTRLRRKFAGEPFVYDPPISLTATWTVRLVRRAQSPRMFAFFVLVEVAIWSSGTLVQLAFLSGMHYFTWPW